jgi:hypothetical protein
MKQAGWLAVAGCVMLGARAMAELAISGGDESAAKPLAVPKPADATPAALAAGAGGQDTVELLNKDKLHGTLMGVTAGEYGLKWKHGSAEKPMDFSLASVGSVALSPRKATAGTPATAAIYLSNGDMLPGTVVSLDNEKLVVDTGYAGRLNINRLMIKAISPNIGVSSVVYEGPGALSDWTMPRGGRNQAQWTCKNGVLSALQSYQIGRFIEGMPDVVDIQFEAAWRNNYPSFYFMFYTENIQDQRNGYMLQMNGGSIYLQRYTPENGSSNLGGSENYDGFSNGRMRQARFNLLVDKNKKTFTLLINGSLVKQWTETANFAGKGNGISFRPNNHGDLRISRIRISQWDGRLPEAGGGSSDKGTKEDLVRFVNNDKVSGQLKSIANGVAKLETSYATMDVPLARVAEIVTATEKSERARKNKEDIRATFTEKGVLTLQLLRIEKDEIKGKSENFGDITLPLGVLRSLDFNIYQERKPADDDETAADGAAEGQE